MREPSRQQVSQRWLEPRKERGEAEKASSRSSWDSRVERAPLVPWRRLIIECGALLVIVCIFTGFALLFASRYDECVLRSGIERHPAQQFISVRSLTGMLQWQVDAQGQLFASAEPSPNATFRMEQYDDTWVCLRWLGDMRVVEVQPVGAANPWALTTGGYACGDRDAQLFALKGRSVRRAARRASRRATRRAPRRTRAMRVHVVTRPPRSRAAPLEERGQLRPRPRRRAAPRARGHRPTVPLSAQGVAADARDAADGDRPDERRLHGAAAHEARG